MSSRRLKWSLLSTCLLLLFADVAGVVVVTEGAMHPPRLKGYQQPPVTVVAKDGAVLRAWWVVPEGGATRAVIVCHGIGDSSRGGSGFAPLFLSHGSAVLAPDSRGHGESGGFVTFGIREADDVVQWLQWIKARTGISRVYGLGESLGGAVLLESLERGADLRAIVAESPYASFTEIADDRIGQFIGPVAAPVVVREALLYAGMRYHVDLAQAQPARAVVNSRVPILLIHGAADKETLPKHSEEIARANPAIQVWLVPNALHTGAWAAAPAEFERRVLDWFQK